MDPAPMAPRWEPGVSLTVWGALLFGGHLLKWSRRHAGQEAALSPVPTPNHGHMSREGRLRQHTCSSAHTFMLWEFRA